jgi:hypothetical protein
MKPGKAIFDLVAGGQLGESRQELSRAIRDIYPPELDLKTDRGLLLPTGTSQADAYPTAINPRPDNSNRPTSLYVARWRPNKVSQC